MASAMLEKSIHQVKDMIESRQFIRVLKLIKELESEYPSSASLLVLKALVYAKLGYTEALSICENAKEKIFADTSVLPDVLNTFQTICQLLKRNDLAITFFEYACGEVPNDLGLMMGLFQCYVRESLFVNQLMICLKMYKLSREDKFLMWAVLSIQLQVVSHLVKKHATTHNLDEPEVYISVAQQQGKYDHAREILSMLGTTLLICEVERLHMKGGILLACLCDYAAAMEILRQKSETCPEDWECFLSELGQLLEDSQWCGATTDNEIHPPIVLACKLSQLSNEEFGTNLSEALNLKLASLPMEVHGCLHGKEYDQLAADEYFSRLGADTKVTLQVSREFEELQLINNLWTRFINSSPPAIGLDEVSEYHGTSIALKTNSFILVAADGKLTIDNYSKGLNLKADKVHCLDDMGVAICGSWKTLRNTVGMLKRHFRSVKNERSRPMVSELADFLKEELSSCQGKSGIILGAFDQLEEGRVPCISFADDHTKIDVTQPFFCSGTGERFASQILSEGNVHMNMSLDEAICLVERAFVYVSLHDSCTSGWANIYVIEVDKPIRAMTRERISTTLWRRHHLSLPKRHT
ncbi:hypothetical protein MKW98_006594 [Papaver atlanticum]|uniref:Uncharacterized protein n=1 Tax=Papaver atlanticum TaxID=357466 RepID=A0AAD4XSP0_9MAGN|nr:hypothetical protein MKW98_006594 [Papaver atlanticum]